MHDQARAAALGELSGFRRELHASLTARADALFELADAVLCADGPVTSLVELTLVAEHRRGHGAMYDALSHGRIEPQRLRRTLASVPLPTAADGRIVLAVDVSPWLRPDAPTSALARPLAEDLRRSWEQPATAHRLTPARVRHDFRNIRPTAAQPASAPKPSRPGPGRPPGSRNRHQAISHDAGKTVKRDLSVTAKRQRTG